MQLPSSSTLPVEQSNVVAAVVTPAANDTHQHPGVYVGAEALCRRAASLALDIVRASLLHLREVLEESGAKASIIKYVGKSDYTFTVPEDTVSKSVHWYLMMADSYYSKPQREEYFMDSGYYKFYEAYHLLKFSNEKQILEKAYNEYLELKKNNLWGSKKYF